MRLVVSIMLMVALFPVLDISCKAFNLSSGTIWVMFLLYTLESVLVTLLIPLTGFIKFKRRDGRKKFQKVLVVVLSLVMGVIYSLVVRETSVIFWIVSAIVVGLAFKWVYFLDLEKLANAYLYIIVSGVYIVCTFLNWQSQFESTQYTFVYVIFYIAFAILMNRSNLERVIYRRSKNLDSVPKNIFTYNLKLTTILCLVPIPILLLSGRVGSALYGLMVSSARGVLYLGSYISSLFAKDTVPIETVEEEESEAYQSYYDNSSSMFWDILMVAFIVMLIFIVYRYHDDIIRRIRDFIDEVKRTLLRGRAVDTTRQVQSSEGYVDYVKSIPNKYSKKDFKRDYKSYLKMSTTAETLRFGYATLVNGLNLLDYNISEYDTVTNISSKYKCEEFSKVYLSVRYNEVPPTDENRLLLDNLLKDVHKKV